MSLIDELTHEHDLIEAVLGAFRTYIARRLADTAPAAEAVRFFRFFRVYVGRFHHEREESVLFTALRDGLGLPADRGPIAALLAQHHELAACLDTLEPLLVPPARPDPATHPAIDALTTRYVHGLWRHIDAENSVLFPESEARLLRAGLSALPARPPAQDELAARADGERLTRDYPPVYDPSAMRGDGCPGCPSFGTTCEGLERTWWNESEWEEAADHLG